MLKILQARLQQYMNRELPDVQAGFRKGRGTRDQIANIHRIIKKARDFQKNIYFCFIDYAKAFDCVDHNKLWKIVKEMGIPDHLTCLLRNLYAGQEERHCTIPQTWLFGRKDQRGVRMKDLTRKEERSPGRQFLPLKLPLWTKIHNTSPDRTPPAAPPQMPSDCLKVW